MPSVEQSEAAERRSAATGDKVDFVIGGTQKGGTTALYVYLCEHPEVCMAAQKEVHFFDTDANFETDRVDYSAYRAAFHPKPTQKLLGEATPIYMYWEPVPERMREYNPDMKIIVVLRNPVTRAYSHWNHERQAGREPLPFHEALLAEPERAQKLHPRQLRRYSYIDRGFYTRQLQRLWQHFPLAQTLVLKTDDLRGHPNEVLSEVARFLGIASFPPIPVRTVHAREYARPMNVVERSYLIGVFADEIRALERMLGWDCREWLER